MALEKTLSIIKPDAISKGFAEEICKRLEDAGLKIASKKSLHLTEEEAEGFYKAKIASGKYYMSKILPETGSLMSSILSGAKSYNEFDDKYFDLGFKL